MQRFCPACGKVTDKLYEGLCKDCFFRRIKLISIPERIECVMCASCHRAKINTAWRAFKSKKQMIRAIVEKHAVLYKNTQLNIDISKFSFKQLEQQPLIIPLNIRATLALNGRKIFTKKSVQLSVRHEVCPECIKVKSKYYEAVLQLRGLPQQVNVLKRTIMDRIDKLAPFSRLAFISQIKPQRGGVDLYLGSATIAERITKEIRKIYNVEIKKTYTQAGVREGKRFYRKTILLRIKSKK